jgi:hypothetical protein
VLVVVAGRARLDPKWGLPDLVEGACVLLPAAIGEERIEADGKAGIAPKLLHVHLP